MRLKRSMTMFRLRCLICSTLLIIPFTGNADIYKYRDADGRLTFVDDQGKIPSQFRHDVTTITEAKVPLGENGSLGKENLSASVPFAGTDTKAPSPAKRDLRQQQTPVEIRDNGVFIPAEVSMGNRVVKLSLLLDTGATTTVFHRNSLARLDLPSGKSYEARVAGGGTVKSQRIKFRQIRIGPFEEKTIYAMVIDNKGQELPFDGMLGMDFLKSHPYHIDFDNQVINWHLGD